MANKKKMASRMRCTVVVVGDSKSGKTALVRRFVDGTFGQVGKKTCVRVFVPSSRFVWSHLGSSETDCPEPTYEGTIEQVGQPSDGRTNKRTHGRHTHAIYLPDCARLERSTNALSDSDSVSSTIGPSYSIVLYVVKLSFTTVASLSF